MVNDFPGSEIAIFIEVLQGDGGTRAAGITAASVALASAGIHMKDLPYAISIGRIEEHLALDFNMIEDNYSDSDMPLAIAPRNNEILLLQMDGGMTRDQMSKALRIVLEAGKKISEAQKSALKEAYAVGTEK
jgi:exosome complex component RRP41